MLILVTGGLGFIGSHCCIQLIDNGHHVIIIDNLHNANKDVCDKINKITNKPEKLDFINIDMCNYEELENNLPDNIDTVIHFAGLKAVNESVNNPILYYHTNLTSTLNLIKFMENKGIKNLIFSSSATVYGNPTTFPIKETDDTSWELCGHPYGQTKSILEKILQCVSTKRIIKVICLRYFNPVGCHPSGLIGENPKGTPNNLMPYIVQVIIGRRSHLEIFGVNYNTNDGTCIRDYVHVMDVADAFVSVLKSFDHDFDYNVYNVGTGKGVSVLELVNGMKKYFDFTVIGSAKREGDLPVCYGDVSQIKEVVGWEAKRDLDDICRDMSNYIKKNFFTDK